MRLDDGSHTRLDSMTADRREALQIAWSSSTEGPERPTVIVAVPSLTVDEEVLANSPGVDRYEERMLYLVSRLRDSSTRVVYITSQALDPPIVAYYGRLFNVPTESLATRFRGIDCQDESSRPLTRKILVNPRVLRQVNDEVRHDELCYIESYYSTEMEHKLANTLDLPILASGADLQSLVSKSGARRMFRDLRIPCPTGFEDVDNEYELAAALCELKVSNPSLGRAAVKLNHGYSGLGNAIYDFERRELERNRVSDVLDRLPGALRLQDHSTTTDDFFGKMREQGCVVEELIEEEPVRSPSVQGFIDPYGSTTVISTHEQLLGGPCRMSFQGCAFPAHRQSRRHLEDAGDLIGARLASAGAVGWFSVDFIATRRQDDVRHYALEIDLRKGGTTPHLQLLNELTEGSYSPGGSPYPYATGAGEARSYVAYDHLTLPGLRGWSPGAVVDALSAQGLHYDRRSQIGALIPMMGAIERFGRLGLMCVERNETAARSLCHRALSVLEALPKRAP